MENKKENKKVAIISDIHFGVNKNSELFLNSSLKFFKTQFVPYLIENDINVILVLGDVFDSRSSINVKTNNEVWTLFSEVLKGFNVKILVGNHDIYYKTTIDVNSLKGLNELKDVDVIKSITHMDILGINCLMCPWIVDYDDKEFHDALNNSNADVLFGHFDIVGFTLNSSKVSDVGVKSDVFSNFKKVFSGHYHTPSSKKIGRTEIVYIGSPYQIDRNDMNDDKGFIILNLETLRYKRVINTTSLKFITVEYPDLPKDFEVNGNIVDAHITVTKNQLKNNLIDEYLSNLESMHPAEKINPIFTVVSDDQVDMGSSIDNGIHSIPDLLELYINNDDSIDDNEKTEIFNITMAIHDGVSS